MRSCDMEEKTIGDDEVGDTKSDWKRREEEEVAAQREEINAYVRRCKEERERERFKSPLERLKRSIRSKSNWEEKIRDELICEKYRTEAVQQGIPGDIVDSALKQLLEESNYILGNHDAGGQSSCGSTIPSHSAAAAAAADCSPAAEVDWNELETAVSAAQANVSDMMVEPLEEKGNGLWVVDKVVPKKLRDLLSSRLDAIADKPDKDFHPGSNNQVQDLIHPSLFPFIENVSPTFDPQSLPDRLQIAFWSRQYEDSTYQWLPSEFHVDAKGSVKISSYINNLEEGPNQDLYKAIQHMFEIFLPMFERILFDNEPLLLRDRGLQVIVKAANYVIQPKGEVYEGSWHVEGMSHEHIVASGIYYYSTSPFLIDWGLEFRRERDPETDYPSENDWDRGMEDDQDYPDLDGLTMTVPLGAVPTVEDRLLVFPNGLQHKLSRVVNVSEDQVGVRKILVFFLVHPDRKIVSTIHVPEQQWDRFKPKLLTLMILIAKRVVNTSVPLPLIIDIVNRAKQGFTMEEARRHRLELMRERKFKIDHENEEWEREYSLCEH